MRILIQRVNQCKVIANGQNFSSIGKGLLVLVGIEGNDGVDDLLWLAKKVCQLRIFNDENGVMNLSINDIKGDVMVVSQFTLHASTKKGNRPSYVRAANPEMAIPLYEKFVEEMKKGIMGRVATGVFGADMQLDFINSGPVTIFMDSKNKE